MVKIIQSRTREGWNINGQNCPNWNFIKSEAKKNPPRWTLIMDNQDKAREWKDKIGGELTYRSWHLGEAEFHLHNDPKWAAQQMARETEKVADCWQQWKQNEASGPWPVLQDWIIQYATEARKQNRKVTTNGLALLKLWKDPAYVEAGNVDKIMKFWADGNNREWFIPNVHVYITGRTSSSVAPYYPANLLDLEASRNSRQYHINSTNYYEPLQWYHRELWAFNVRAMQIIGEPVDFIIDEAKNDYHASVQDTIVTFEGRTAKLDVFLRERYGDPRFNREMRGILGQRKFAEWVITGELNSPIPDERYCDFLIDEYQWWEDEYPDNCLAVMNYTMNPDWRYPTAENGNFGHDAIPLAPILLPKMATIKPRSQSTPIPPVEPDPIPDPAPIPVPVGTIDLLPYLKGDGRIYDMRYSWSGGGIQRIQTQVDGARFFQVKGHPLSTAFEWEELWANDHYIYRGTDVSPSPDELYQVERPDGTYGERWFHRFAKVGDTLRSSPIITFRSKSSGSPVFSKPPYAFPHHITFTHFYERKEFNSGIALDNVIELSGYLDDNSKKGTKFEVYYYAKDYGLVAWKDPLTNRESHIVTRGIQRADLPRLELSWLTLPPVPDTLPDTEVPPERIMNPIVITGYNNAGQYPSNPNIRASASISGAIVGRLPASPVVTHGYVSTDAPTPANGYTWQYYELLIDQKTVSGYIANELVRPVSDAEQHYDFQLGSLTFSWTLEERDDIVDIFNIAAAILDNTEAPYTSYAEDIRTFAAAIDSVEGTP